MKKLITDSNYEQLNNLFKEKNFSKFEKFFFDYEQKKLLCEKSFNLFGVYQSSLKNYSLSIKYFEKSISLNNKYYVAKINLAGTLNKIGQLLKAKSLLEEVLSVHKNNINALKLLSIIYEQVGQLSNQEKILKQIIDLYPLDSNSYYNLGFFYYKRNDLNEAEINFKKSIQLNSKYFFANYYLALVYKSKKNIKDAKFILKFLINYYPKIRESFYSLSDIYRGIGDFEKSNSILVKVLDEIDQLDPYSIYHLLSSPYYKDKIKIINYCEKNYHLFDENLKERIGYAFFKYYDDEKNFFNASNYLKKSLKITISKYKYSSKIDNEQFIFLKKIFDNNFKNKHKICNEKIENIFIVGMQRSGSTLLEQMLTTHNDMESYGELPFFADLITKYFPNQDLISFENDIINSKSSLFIDIGREYNQMLKSIKPFKISVDKMLSNFRMIGFIIASIPNCLIINIHRNKNDNLLSVLSNYFENSSAPWSYDEEDLKKYYSNYLSLMCHWRKLYPKKIIDISYEKLIKDPKHELEKILNRINISWSQEFLNYKKNKNIVETASIYQVRQSIYDKSINRWKNYKNYFPKLFEN